AGDDGTRGKGPRVPGDDCGGDGEGITARFAACYVHRGVRARSEVAESGEEERRWRGGLLVRLQQRGSAEPREGRGESAALRGDDKGHRASGAFVFLRQEQAVELGETDRRTFRACGDAAVGGAVSAEPRGLRCGGADCRFRSAGIGAPTSRRTGGRD